MPQLALYPYLLEGACWVFDDQRAGLKEEAFVLGMTETISKVVEAKSIPNADKRFTLTFAAEPFDHDVALIWMSPGDVAATGKAAGLPGIGNWYRGTVCGEEMIGWLCPAVSYISPGLRRGFTPRPSRCPQASIRSGTSMRMPQSPEGSCRRQASFSGENEPSFFGNSATSTRL